MLEIRKTTQKPMVLVRTATGNELSNYEKHKLANIEDNAQENKIEVITLNGERLQIDAAKKEVNINLGNLAFKNTLSPDDLSMDELFFIKCELDESSLKRASN